MQHCGCGFGDLELLALDAPTDSVLEESDFRTVTATGTAFGRARLLLDIWEHNQSRWAIGEIDVDEFRRRVVDEMAVVPSGVATADGRAALEAHLPTRGTPS